MTIELTLLSRVALRDREITSPRLRELLALLAEDPRGGCDTARLIAGLWPEAAPANPGKALQVLVSRARSQLGAGLIASTPTGYRLTLDPEAVDAAAIRSAAETAARLLREGDPAAALAEAGRGLSLWDGDGGELAMDPVSELRSRRRADQAVLVRTRAVAAARLGRHAEALPELSALVDGHPRDEELLAELLTCEAATAGPAQALSRYETYRNRLRDELGADPGPTLRAAHAELLRATEPVVRNGIVHDPNPLLGRAADIAAVTHRLRDFRVVSVVGIGGLGKTRLAHAVGARAEHRLVQFVPLGGITADEDVVVAVARALGVDESRGTRTADLLRGITRALGRGPALLILDNCEQVLSGVAELVGTLVSVTPELRVLTTSRAPLGLSSEAVHPLPELTEDTAVALFVQRATAVRPDARLDRDEVAELCRRLDGLPLAVELAAARTRVMSVPEISRRLADRFGLLRGGPRDAPARHRTLYAVVEWSWNLLDEPDRFAMRALSFFPAPFTAEAAQALLGEEFDVFDTLDRLSGQSLVEVVDSASGTRFRMLATVRQFAADRLADSGDAAAVRAAYLTWARESGVAQADRVLDATAMTPLRDDGDNLDLALRLALADGDADTVAATWAPLSGLWFADGAFLDLGRHSAAVARVLSHHHPEPPHLEVTRLAAATCAVTALIAGTRERRSLAVLRRLPSVSPDTPARALAHLLGRAEELLRPDSAALRELCDSRVPALALVANTMAGYLWEQVGDRREALAATARAVDAVAADPDPWLRYQTHVRRAEQAMLAGEPDLACEQLLKALDCGHHTTARVDRDGIWQTLATANLHRGDLDEASRWLRLVEDHIGHDSVTRAYVLGTRAEILLADGQTDAGLRQWRAAHAATAEAADPLQGLDPHRSDLWSVEIQAAAVAAHARAGRGDEVADLASALTDRLSTMVATPRHPPAAYLAELPLCGAALLALSLVDADGEPERAAAELALAAAMGVSGAFPSLSPSTVRDRVGATAKSYADLTPAELRAEAARLRGF